MEEPSFAELQRQVQRKLGRCLIRIQQYELLLKEVVGKRQVSGLLRGPAKQLSTNLSAVTTNTMGQLVGELTNEYFQPRSNESAHSQDDSSSAESEAPPGWVSLRMSVSMEPDAHAQLKADLQDLVDLRNDLVHHFVEGQDLMSVEGCMAADMYLESSYDEIDRHLVSLRDWATSMNDAKQAIASFLASPEYRERLRAELFPSDTQRETALPGLIALLRRAEAEHMKDGWTALNHAIAFVSEVAPGETPKKHTFGSWRHVLREARVFEVRRGPAPTGAAMETWYRSRG